MLRTIENAGIAVGVGGVIWRGVEMHNANEELERRIGISAEDFNPEENLEHALGVLFHPDATRLITLDHLAENFFTPLSKADDAMVIGFSAAIIALFFGVFQGNNRKKNVS